MNSRCIAFIAVFLLGGVFLCPLTAEQNRIVLGLEDRWGEISSSEGTRLEKGYRGFMDIVMDYRQYAPESGATDALLHFEGDPFRDHASNYLVQNAGAAARVAGGRIGEAAAGFSREKGGLTLEILRDADRAAAEPALFTPGSVWGDFSIEFWMRPDYLEDGEKIFRWEGQRLLGENLQLQSLDCSVRGRLLEWSFENFFLPAGQEDGKEEKTFSLKGKNRLIPGRWNHHLLRYDGKTGLIEYLVDGRPEAVLYVTSSGRPGGSVMKPYIGAQSRGFPEIAPSYSGLLDEFRITRTFVTEPDTHRFSPTGGMVEIGPIDLDEAGSEIYSIEAETHTPEGTGIYSYYRTAENRPAFDLENPEWIPFRPGALFEPAVRASFLMLRFELFPDGRGLRSPRVSSVAVGYRPNLPPPPPQGLTALPGNGRVRLTWQELQQGDLGGYLVFYGDAPGVYRGEVSSEGPSPVDLGTATELVLSGLENGKLYYFAVAAYDTVGPAHRGPLSGEVSARPSAYYGD
jgi:hypothetical protein